ncbi:hypothetical protein T439DRAFT_320252 [Meredithblackwellia eburnea MCA 4105]
MAKASRSQFIEKLHNLLEHPLDPTSLRWVSHDAFEITCHDGRARHALSPSWDFRSLSSFIRQLSYYNFKRLSDRRRSSERRSSASGYIVFSHPSGFFLQGDASRLHGIVRKTRNRPEKTGIRRASTSSIQSSGLEDDGDVPPMPHWPPADTRQMGGYTEERRHLHHFSSIPTFQPSFPSVRQPSILDTPWRPYQPTQAWADAQTQRRASDFGINPISPRTKRVELSDLTRPPMPRKAGSLSIVPLAANVNSMDEFRSPYPTPTFSNFTDSRSGSESMPSGMPSGMSCGYDDPRGSFSAPYQGFASTHQPLPSPTASVYSSASDSHPHEESGGYVDHPGSVHHLVDPRSTIGNGRPGNQMSFFSNHPVNWIPPPIQHRASISEFPPYHATATVGGESPRR